MKRSAVLLALLLAASCHRSGRKVIGVVPKANSHVFWLSVKTGAEAAGKEFNVDVEWNGPASETDYARQIQIVDSMIARHVDGLAVAASERKALAQPVEHAFESGIPTVVFDSGVDSNRFTSFIATDNYAGGGMAARELAKVMGGKGTVALMMHAPGSTSTMDREKGFEDTLTKEFPGMQIVARQYGMSDRAKARSAAENILTAHPDLGGIFASSEPSSVGTSLAIQARNLTGKVHFVAFDSEQTIERDLRAGVIDAVVVQDPYGMGYETVRTLVQSLRGTQVPRKIDMPAKVVERADLDKPEIKKLLHPTD